MDCVPLTYIIHEDENPAPANEIFANEHQCLIVITPLHGLELEMDNGKVFDYLKLWTHSGPGWTWIRTYGSTWNR
jgi:hypothetical protein